MLREAARRIAPLYWLVGVARLTRHRARLRSEDRRYAARHPRELPPPALRFRVHGGFDEAAYLNAGRVLAEVMVSAWRRHRGGDAPSILEFGSGPGRVATQVKTAMPSCRLTATDLDDEAIAWARENLAEVGAFEVNGAKPPLGHGAASFDFAYAISVFTHLDEAAQHEWLAELARVLRPGGLLVASVHGAPAQRSCTRRERIELAERGFAYRVDRRGQLKLDGLPDSYQTTFHSRAYVEANWQRDFELLEYTEGGLAGHQDLVVLARR